MCRSALPALLLLVVLATMRGDSGASAGKEALDRVCGSLGSYYVTPGLCLSALCSNASDPCRTSCDAPAVAALAARLAAQNATAAQGSIQAAAANATLTSCLQLYVGTVLALRWASVSVAAGRYRGAREVLQAVQYAATGCEGVMAGDAAAVLLLENGWSSDMAFVAHAIVAYMVASD